MPPRILIADDHLTFRRALRQYLEGVDDWEVIEASDGEEAVVRSIETRPNIIVVDLAMPGKDGFATAREISKLLPETPILMCTMHMSAHVQAEAEKSGIRRVLSKADSSLVVPAIRQFLNLQEQIRDSESLPIPAVASDPVPPAAISPTNPPEPGEPPSELPKNVV